MREDYTDKLNRSKHWWVVLVELSTFSDVILSKDSKVDIATSNSFLKQNTCF